MAKNVDPRRDIWGALIADSEETKTSLGANDAHFLFVGHEKCGKSSLLNSFFNRLEEPRPTLALSYQSCTLHVQEIEKILHFWELGGGMNLEKILSTIITPEIEKNFYVFVVLDLMNFSSIETAMEWLPTILRRFKSGFGGCFIAGTHYDEFEEKDPSFKAQIVNGIFSLCHQYGTGFFTFTPKFDSLISRFKSLIKSLLIPDVKKPERVSSHNGPTLTYPNDDVNGGETIQSFATFVKSEALKQTTSNKQKRNDGSINPDDPQYADEGIDKVVREQSKILDDKLKALIASI
ncbi:Cytoplasmic dynein 2 light intermediate chain 1 [Tritrichomonas musculus]|uniref:Cytoplasmic dynein 2 light intermediate chain 1 n=1 Tax=Tritrichomonas musculus TaxID=1915356 RepID=A0ABR2K475_9EUKA